MTDLGATRTRVEHSAAVLLVGTALVMAIVCGAIIVSGWFSGGMEDRAENVFYLGAVLEFVTIAVFAAAAFPGGRDDLRAIRRVTWLVRVGLVLFILSPALCIGAMIADYYG